MNNNTGLVVVTKSWQNLKVYSFAYLLEEPRKIVTARLFRKYFSFKKRIEGRGKKTYLSTSLLFFPSISFLFCVSVWAYEIQTQSKVQFVTTGVILQHYNFLQHSLNANSRRCLVRSPYSNQNPFFSLFQILFLSSNRVTPDQIPFKRLQNNSVIQ